MKQVTVYYFLSLMNSVAGRLFLANGFRSLVTFDQTSIVVPLIDDGQHQLDQSFDQWRIEDIARKMESSDHSYVKPIQGKLKSDSENNYLVHI